ncbi:MAG: AAA family ATPase [Ruminococcus sp.]|nr:AAA family ATPase [Ruminococcus sp.]
MQSMDYIFIIGAPAVGKTTLAGELYKRLGGVCIEQNGVPEFVIPSGTADEGDLEETLCWENVLSQARFFAEKGFKNIVILDIDDVRTREIPSLFRGKSFIILRLFSSDIGQIVSQMEKRRANEGGLYDIDLARRLNAKMSRRPFLPNEVGLDISGKNQKQVLDDSLAIMGDFVPLTDYEYDPDDVDIKDYCSWVWSRGLK